MRPLLYQLLYLIQDLGKYTLPGSSRERHLFNLFRPASKIKEKYTFKYYLELPWIFHNLSYRLYYCQ